MKKQIQKAFCITGKISYFYLISEKEKTINTFLSTISHLGDTVLFLSNIF